VKSPSASRPTPTSNVVVAGAGLRAQEVNLTPRHCQRDPVELWCRALRNFGSRGWLGRELTRVCILPLMTRKSVAISHIRRRVRAVLVQHKSPSLPTAAHPPP
jgi:hypothetical protein